jgi:acyl-CoA hydrolase
MEQRYARESRCYKTSRIFPTDVNNHNTLFGGKLMSYIDDIASIAASKHCRRSVVTASTDSVDFLHPIHPTDSVCLESFVTWTGKSSITNLKTGHREIAATSFITFVALDDERRPVLVPEVIAETEEEIKLHESAPHRAEIRRIRREESRKLAGFLTMKQPWE